MMRTNYLKPGSQRDLVLQFLSRVADISLMKEHGQCSTTTNTFCEDGPAKKEDSPEIGKTELRRARNIKNNTITEDEPKEDFSCVTYDILISNNANQSNIVVELVSWTSKQAYETYMTTPSAQQNYDELAKVVLERYTVSFWERNEDILPES
jgi:quinol monooxygenase YgiN